MLTKKQIRQNDDDYAAHLYCEIFEVNEDGDDCNTRRILDALNTLTERERRVVECRYRLDATYDEIGKELNVTRERARQIFVKAIRKLRHPARVRDMSVAQIERERDTYKQTAAEQAAVINELRRQIAEFAKVAPVPEGVPVQIVLFEQPIADLGLSVRSYNCLTRAGINTVGDLYELPTGRELRLVRNLGRKSHNEIICKMRELGFTDWADRMTRY